MAGKLYTVHIVALFSSIFRMQAAIQMGENYSQAKVRLAGSAKAAEAMYKAARRSGRVFVI